MNVLKRMLIYLGSGVRQSDQGMPSGAVAKQPGAAAKVHPDHDELGTFRCRDCDGTLRIRPSVYEVNGGRCARCLKGAPRQASIGTSAQRPPAQQQEEAQLSCDGATDALSLTCGLCGAVYRIGIDAAVVSDEDVYRGHDVIVLTDGKRKVRLDLIAPIKSSWEPELQEEHRKHGPEAVALIKSFIAAGQERYWYCGSCNNEKSPNEYPWSAMRLRQPVPHAAPQQRYREFMGDVLAVSYPFEWEAQTSEGMWLFVPRNVPIVRGPGVNEAERGLFLHAIDHRHREDLRSEPAGTLLRRYVDSWKLKPGYRDARVIRESTASVPRADAATCLEITFPIGDTQFRSHILFIEKALLLFRLQLFATDAVYSELGGMRAAIFASVDVHEPKGAL